MSHYEERLERDLADLKERVLAVGAEVEEALRCAERVVVHGDRALASRTILGDNRINRAIRDVDARCHAFVARHLPSAGHLRFVSSVLRIDLELERIGDYAATICREALQLDAPPPQPLLADFEVMSAHGRNLLHARSQAFREGSADLARGTLGLAQPQRAMVRKLFADLLREGEVESRPLRRAVRAAHRPPPARARRRPGQEHLRGDHLRRHRRDQAAEAFTILFVDQRNDRASQLAEAWARKYYPKSGGYMSAGWEPADRWRPSCSSSPSRTASTSPAREPKADRALPAELDDSTSSSASTAIRGRSRRDSVPHRGAGVGRPGHDGAARRSGATHRGRAPEPDRAHARRACRVSARARHPSRRSGSPRHGLGDRPRRSGPHLPRRRVGDRLHRRHLRVHHPRGHRVHLRRFDPVEFFTSPRWLPTSNHNPTYGALALIAGTASVTGLAMLVAVPLSLGAAIYIAEFARGRTREALKVLVELLAAIPSVVWGFIGLSVMNPLIIEIFDVPVGLNVLNAGVILGLMAAPIMTTIAEDALKAVPDSYREAAEALGATRSRLSSAWSSRRRATAWSRRCCSASGAASARPWRC